MVRFDVNKVIGTLTVLKKWVASQIRDADWTGINPKVYVLGMEGEHLEIDKCVVYDKYGGGWYRTVLCLLDEEDVAYCDVRKNGDYVGYAKSVYGYGNSWWKWSWGEIKDADI